MDMTKGLRAAIRHFDKSQTALAKAIGKEQGHVGKWLHRDKKVPAEVCADIEAATGGKVTCHQLRPDVFRQPTGAA